MRTKLEKVEAELREQGEESLGSLLSYYTELGYSVGLVGQFFEVSLQTVRQWFKHFGLEYRVRPLPHLTPKLEGNPELARELGKQKATVLNGINIPNRERELKLSRGTIGVRLKRGWSVEAALNTGKSERVRARSQKCKRTL